MAPCTRGGGAEPGRAGENDPAMAERGASQRVQILVSLGVGDHEAVTFTQRPTDLLVRAANLLEGEQRYGQARMPREDVGDIGGADRVVGIEADGRLMGGDAVDPSLEAPGKTSLFFTAPEVLFTRPLRSCLTM